MSARVDTTKQRVRLGWEVLEQGGDVYGWRSAEFMEGDGPVRWHIGRTRFHVPSRRSSKDRGTYRNAGWWVRLEYRADDGRWVMSSVGLYADDARTNFRDIRSAKRACEIATAGRQVEA